MTHLASGGHGMVQVGEGTAQPAEFDKIVVWRNQAEPLMSRPHS